MPDTFNASLNSGEANPSTPLPKAETSADQGAFLGTDEHNPTADAGAGEAPIYPQLKNFIPSSQ